MKLGLTSRPKQQAMGIDSPLTAWLTDGMALPPGAPLPYEELIHPRVEPEIVFVMSSELKGPGLTAEAALRAVDSVHAGFEVIDSRYADFKFRLPDVVADNASSSRFVISPDGIRLGGGAGGLDLAAEVCVLSVDGQVIDTATGAAVMGDPAAALALAANSLGERGLAVKAGAVVLTGGLTDAVAVAPGHTVTAEFTHLGRLTLG